MRCERCGADTTVTVHSIDGYSGHLCTDCLTMWDVLTASE